MIYLNEGQKQRLYDVFDFAETETIVSASLESANGGWLEINYVDETTHAIGCYKPYLAKHSQEDAVKVDYILNGIKLTRNPK